MGRRRPLSRFITKTWCLLNRQRTWTCFAAMMVNGQADGDLRLTGFESSRLAGRVEMNFFGSWYTICNNFFTLREAAVVCRQLGLGYPVRIFNQDTDGPDKMKTSDSPVSRLVIYNCGLWLMWFCVTKIFMWSTFNQTGLVLAVALLPWMMWAALGKNLTSLVAHTVHLVEDTTVLYGNLWEFNAVSICKHISIHNLYALVEWCKVKGNEKGMAMKLIIMQIIFCIYNAYLPKDMIDSLLCTHKQIYGQLRLYCYLFCNM